MSRPSRLPVVLRLARLDAREALVALAAAQRAVLALSTERAHLTERAIQAERECAPAPGASALAGTLAQASRFAASIAVQRARLEGEFDAAVAGERRAREAVAAKRARVRAVERAMERRAAREAKVRRRRETRRIDEAVRQVREMAHDEVAHG